MNTLEKLVANMDIGSTLVLTDSETKELLVGADITVVETAVASTVDEAAKAASMLGYPVSLRPVSGSSLLTNTIGSLPLGSEAQLRSTFPELVNDYASWDAEVKSLTVTKVPPRGVEIMVSVFRDSLFGPVLSFGYGKMAVEVWEDVAYRIAPLTEKDSRLIIREPKGSSLLNGYGTLPAPRAEVMEKTLLAISNFVDSNPCVESLCLSPCFAYRDEVIVVEASMTLIKREGV